MLRSIACALLTAALALGCEPGVPGLAVGEIEFTAGSGSGEPNLHVTPDGRVLLSWLEPFGGDRHALRVAVRRGDRWSEPTTIHESDRFFVNWADFPSLVELSEGVWLAHWLEKVAGGTYAYHVRLAISKDAGSSWGAPITPHQRRLADRARLRVDGPAGGRSGGVDLAGWSRDESRGPRGPPGHRHG